MSQITELKDIPGFAVGAVHCGIKSAAKKHEDVGVIVADAPCPTAAVFTRNRICAAPVRRSQEHLRSSGGVCRAVVVNSGNANCATGNRGEADALKMTEMVAEALGVAPQEVLVCSTGIIGAELPMAKLEKGIAEALERAPRGEGDFARAILTTDLVRKTAAVQGELNGRAFGVAGVSKGSGMIAPNMATMLGFITTDVKIEAPLLQETLRRITAQTFNRVTVDGDTSTNDTVIAMASGRSEAVVDEANLGAFEQALFSVCRDLAIAIARDGEGAQHFVTVKVTGAASVEDADRVGKTVAESPLVKTAIAGDDPNWGRILAAAGRSGADVEQETFTLVMNGLRLFADGGPLPRPSDRQLQQVLVGKDTLLEIDLGRGDAEATWYTCDLTHGYITINAEYHT